MTTVAIDPRLRARRADVLRRRGRRRLVIVTVVVALAALGAAAYGLVHSPMLDVDRVEVRGAVQTPPDAVRAAAGIEPGVPMAAVDLREAREAVAALPWVHSVTSSRRWPSEVRFDVVEREPAAVVDVGDRRLVVDLDGRVLEEAAGVPAGPVVVGDGSWAAAPGEWIPSEAVEAVEVAAAIPARLAEALASVHLDAGQIWLELRDGGRVVVGDVRDLDAKMLAAVTVLIRVDLCNVDVIDVRVPMAPVLTRRAECT